jgi:hypothetical protein
MLYFIKWKIKIWHNTGEEILEMKVKYVTFLQRYFIASLYRNGLST